MVRPFTNVISDGSTVKSLTCKDKKRRIYCTSMLTPSFQQTLPTTGPFVLLVCIVNFLYLQMYSMDIIHPDSIVSIEPFVTSTLFVESISD